MGPLSWWRRKDPVSEEKHVGDSAVCVGTVASAIQGLGPVEKTSRAHGHSSVGKSNSEEGSRDRLDLDSSALSPRARAEISAERGTMKPTFEDQLNFGREMVRRIQPYTTTIVGSFGAFLLISGIAIGFRRQSRIAAEELADLKVTSRKWRKKPEDFSAFERMLRLDRQLTPRKAATRALLGGTILVSGSTALLIGGAYLLGIRSVTEVVASLEDTAPRYRKAFCRIFGIKIAPDLTQEEIEEETRALGETFKRIDEGADVI